MQRNIELLKTVREVIGYDVDLMAAHTWVGHSTMPAHVAVAEPFQLRWRKNQSSDDTHALQGLKVTAAFRLQRRA